MKRLLFIFIFIFIFILISSSVYSAGPTESDDTTVISSLPYTTTIDETHYRLDGDLYSDSMGILANCFDCTILLNGYTVYYGATEDDSYGINITNRDITIDNGNVTQNGETDGCTSIILTLTHDVFLHDVFMYPQGTNSKGINCPSVGSPGNYNIEMDGGGGASFVHAYDSRCQGDGNFLWFGQHYPGVGEDYGFNIHGVVVDSCPGTAINVGSRSGYYGKSYIYNCTLTVDAWNDFYTTQQDSQACWSAGNAYGIAIGGLGPGSRVHHNVIRSGTSHAGGRGLIMSDCIGTAESRVQVDSNDADCHEGPDVPLWDNNYCQVFRSRWGNAYTHVFGNSFIGRTGDGAILGDNYTNKVYAGRITANDEEGHTPDHDMLIEHNLFAAYGHDADAQPVAMAFETWDGLNNVLQYNKYISSYDIIRFSDINGGGNGNILIGDTLIYDSVSGASLRSVVLGIGDDYESINNTMRDCVFLNGASDTSIYNMNSVALSEITLERGLSFLVLNNSGNPINNAVYSFTDSYDIIRLIDSTDADGLITNNMPYGYSRWSNDVEIDSIFNNYTLIVSYDDVADTSTITFTSGLAIIGGSVTDTIELDSEDIIIELILDGLIIQNLEM